MNTTPVKQEKCSICHKPFDEPVCVDLGKTGKVSHWKCLFDILEPIRKKVEQQKKT
jgi:hypothetical protein